jgi:hypothetical protein
MSEVVGFLRMSVGGAKLFAIINMYINSVDFFHRLMHSSYLYQTDVLSSGLLLKHNDVT